MATSQVARAIFQKIANSRASMGGNRITDGKYLFLIKKMLIEAKFDGTMFIVEFKVLAAEGILPDVQPNKVGTTASYVVNLDKNISAGGNAKAFVLGLLGYKEDEVAPADVEATLADLTDTAQPARGMLIADETYRKPIRSGPNAGKPFTAHRWTYVGQNAPEEVAKRRAELDAEEKAVPAASPT
jgi:hypothetical protein